MRTIRTMRNISGNSKNPEIPKIQEIPKTLEIPFFAEIPFLIEIPNLKTITFDFIMIVLLFMTIVIRIIIITITVPLKYNGINAYLIDFIFKNLMDHHNATIEMNIFNTENTIILIEFYLNP